MKFTRAFKQFGLAGAIVLVAAFVAGPLMAKEIGGKGGVDVDAPTTCGVNECDIFSGEVNGYVLSGQWMIDEASCTTTKKKGMCCKSSGTAMVSGGGDTLDFTFQANRCEKKPSKATLNGSIDVAGGKGKFHGATGKGAMAVTYNPASGKGSIVVDANVK